MIYRLDDLCESQDFEHGQKFVKAEHWKEACDEIEDKVKTIAFKDEEITKLENALKIANKAIGFYADPFNYNTQSSVFGYKQLFADVSYTAWKDEDFIYQGNVGGKRAREAQKQIKEIMEGK